MSASKLDTKRADLQLSDTKRNQAPRRLRWWWALAAAISGGLLLDVASPQLAWWPAAFFGVGLVCAAVWQQRLLPGIAYGFVAGLAFWLPHIFWLTLYLGPVPWLGLAAVMVMWFALFGGAAALTTRGLLLQPGIRGVAWRIITAQSLGVAGLWVLREVAQSSWPYGGFAWGRLVHTQADGPLAQSVSWLGFAGVSGAIAFACALLVAALFAGPGRTQALVSGITAAAILLLLAAVPAAALPVTDTVRVAAVQGNSKSGIFDDRDSGDVLAEHVARTRELLAELDDSGTSVDVIVWPENSAEFDFPTNPLGRLQVSQLAREADAPIVIGSVLANDDGSYTNSALVWDADGATGARYDKQFPVPFAEYMPNREFFRALAPDLVDLVQLEYAAGTGPAALDLETTTAAIRAGIAICFDITFDAQAVAMVDAGAELILAPTNNADFGKTDQSAQQLSIARLRAIETGRALVNISTVGTSAAVAPNGDNLASIEPHTAGFMVSEVPLVEGVTPALRGGAAVAGLWIGMGSLGLILAGFHVARHRRTGS